MFAFESPCVKLISKVSGREGEAFLMWTWAWRGRVRGRVRFKSRKESDDSRGMLDWRVCGLCVVVLTVTEGESWWMPERKRERGGKDREREKERKREREM
jgi:hypothetical protein